MSSMTLRLSALLLSATATLASAALPEGVSCKVTTPAAKSPFQKAYENLIWGKWENFEERDVQFSGLAAPDPSPRYHLLMKKPGAQPNTDKPLVLFLHGFPEFSWAWETWLKQFGTQHDSIAIDLKAYGGSSRVADVAAYESPRLADEIDHIIECLGYKQVITIGHDWGGSLAWIHAIRHPERMKALVVLATPHPYTFYRELSREDSEQRQRSQYIVDIRSGKAKDLLSLGAAAGSGSTGLQSLPFYRGARLNRLFASALSPNSRLQAELNYYRAIPWPKAEDFSYQPTADVIQNWDITVPTLAIWGKADNYFSPKSWEGVESFVPKIDLRGIEGADHWLDHNVPELPSQVLEFVNLHAN